MERKTHHEQWTGQRSVKDRFELGRSRVASFFAGDLDVKEEMLKQGRDGKLKPADLENMTQLAQAYQSTSIQRQLRPRLRTVYHRTAFQRSDSNDIRMSLDFPLNFVYDGKVPYATPNDKERYWKNLEVQIHLLACGGQQHQSSLCGIRSPTAMTLLSFPGQW